MNTPRIAELVAKELGEDGMRFTSSEGVEFDDVLGRHSPTVETNLDEPNQTRYEFSDGSAIVVAGAAWDIEVSVPSLWASDGE